MPETKEEFKSSVPANLWTEVSEHQVELKKKKREVEPIENGKTIKNILKGEREREIIPN